MRGLESQYEAIKHIPDQKAFAIEALKTRLLRALFALRAGKSKSIRKYLATCTSQMAERSVGIDLEALLAREASGGRAREG